MASAYRFSRDFVGQVSKSKNKRQATGPACVDPDDSWMVNSLGKSPCVVAAQLWGVCNAGNASFPALPAGNGYRPESTAGSTTLCSCSWASYNLLQGCAICQTAEGTNNPVTWGNWQDECQGELTDGTWFPRGFVLPSGVAVPDWATTDPTTWPDGIFNTTAAHAIAISNTTELTAAPPTATASSTSSSTSTPKHSSHQGAIIGGAIGGAVLFLSFIGIILYLRKRSRRGEETRGQLARLATYREPPGFHPSNDPALTPGSVTSKHAFEMGGYMNGGDYVPPDLLEVNPPGLNGNGNANGNGVGGGHVVDDLPMGQLEMRVTSPTGNNLISRTRAAIHDRQRSNESNNTTSTSPNSATLAGNGGHTRQTSNETMNSVRQEVTHRRMRSSGSGRGFFGSLSMRGASPSPTPSPGMGNNQTGAPIQEILGSETIITPWTPPSGDSSATAAGGFDPDDEEGVQSPGGMSEKRASRMAAAAAAAAGSLNPMDGPGQRPGLQTVSSSSLPLSSTIPPSTPPIPHQNQSTPSSPPPSSMRRFNPPTYETATNASVLASRGAMSRASASVSGTTSYGSAASSIGHARDGSDGNASVDGHGSLRPMSPPTFAEASEMGVRRDRKR